MQPRSWRSWGLGRFRATLERAVRRPESQDNGAVAVKQRLVCGQYRREVCRDVSAAPRDIGPKDIRLEPKYAGKKIGLVAGPSKDRDLANSSSLSDFSSGVADQTIDAASSVLSRYGQRGLSSLPPLSSDNADTKHHVCNGTDAARKLALDPHRGLFVADVPKLAT
jgi:hypothetical protein